MCGVTIFEGGDFLDNSGAQGTHLISTEERTRLRTADMTQRIFQVGVNLNLDKAEGDNEVVLSTRGPQARRVGPLAGLYTRQQSVSCVKGAWKELRAKCTESQEDRCTLGRARLPASAVWATTHTPVWLSQHTAPQRSQPPSDR